MARNTSSEATETVSKNGTYTVLTKLHHIGPGWKKGDKDRFKKGDSIQLSDAEAAPLLKLKTIEAAK